MGAGIPIPSFWVPHEVKQGDTLSLIAKRYGYANPGPILAFNCDNLPNAIKSWGGPRQYSKEYLKSLSKKKKFRLRLGSGNNRAVDADTVPEYNPLKSNQINSMALSWDHAAWQFGDVISVVSSYPINASLKPKDIPYLEIPWHAKAITEFVSLQQSMKDEIILDTHRLVNENAIDLSALKNVLFYVDVTAAIFLGYKDMVKFGLKRSSGATLETLKKEAYKLLAMRAVRSAGIGYKGSKLGANTSMPTLELPKEVKLKKDVGFWFDNTIGWVSPSKWTGVFAGIWEQDADMAWWGEEAVEAKTRNRIIRDARKRIDRIDTQIHWANGARTRSFYNMFVRDSGA